MFINKPAAEPTDLEKLTDKLTALMLTLEPGSDEYATALEHLAKLESIKKDNRPERLSADAKATIIANLVGIVAIMQHERVNVITTKALSLLTKLR